ncbi:MAG: alkaline phosphatase, partial [Planctomycetales bacterium]|nr:alkaline phosphatase [Planctomycetales bacterium]
YRQMLTHDPDFFIHTGDVVYYDKGKAQPPSKTVKAARQRWNRMFSYTWNRAFPMQVSCYFMK